MDRFDEADQVDVDLTFERDDDIGQLSFAAVGAQVNGAFERLFEQRGFGLGEAEKRSRGTLVAGELHSGAGASNVGVVEELGMWQGDNDSSDIGVDASLRIGEN